ncbi:hypothetical protein [Streptomyces sp. NPDC056244]|uniref:hypothetical protein n=1 Tax=Streptomyces sp. NPDC056244 TaxID=3345762 RepID=UPI0035DEF693
MTMSSICSRKLARQSVSSRTSIVMCAAPVLCAVRLCMAGAAVEQALALLERARGFDRYNVAIHRDIARFQAHFGRHNAMPRTFALLTTTLTELGEEPSSETAALRASLQSLTAGNRPAWAAS